MRNRAAVKLPRTRVTATYPGNRVQQASKEQKQQGQQAEDQPSTSGEAAASAEASEAFLFDELLEALHQAVTQQQQTQEHLSSNLGTGESPAKKPSTSSRGPGAGSRPGAATNPNSTRQEHVDEGLVEELVIGVLKRLDDALLQRLEVVSREQPDTYGRVILELFRRTKSLDVIAQLPPPMGPGLGLEPDFPPLDFDFMPDDFGPDMDDLMMMPEPPMPDWDDYYGEYDGDDEYDDYGDAYGGGLGADGGGGYFLGPPGGGPGAGHPGAAGVGAGAGADMFLPGSFGGYTIDEDEDGEEEELSEYEEVPYGTVLEDEEQELAEGEGEHEEQPATPAACEAAAPAPAAALAPALVLAARGSGSGRCAGRRAGTGAGVVVAAGTAVATQEPAAAASAAAAAALPTVPLVRGFMGFEP